MKPPEDHSVMLMINKDSQLSQYPFYTLNRDIYQRLTDHIILGVLTVNTSSKIIKAIEHTPTLNPYSGYYSNEKISESTKLWRFIELYKFKDLIEKSALYHTRIDKFKDNLEGISPESCKKSILSDNRFTDQEKIKTIELFEKRTKRNRLTSFVSCWHINNEINKDLWNEYGNNSIESIAIETTKSKLTNCFIEKNLPMVFEKIRYYEEPFFNQESYWFPSLFKTKDFEPENEFRSALYVGNPSTVDNVRLKVNLSSLITRIHFHPQATPEFKNTVFKLIEKKGIKVA